jgi:hypothetical protein
MYGKNQSNANTKPTGLGTTLGTSLYGTAIQTIIGRTKAALQLIWANNLRVNPNGSGKKGKGGGKKGGPDNYLENVDLLLGSNPIVTPLQVWANQSDSYTLDFTTHEFTSYNLPNDDPVLSWTDSRFYAVIGVEFCFHYDATFDDYGSTGERHLTGACSIPLWNAAMAGPNPTKTMEQRLWPWFYVWRPGDGPSIRVPFIATNIYSWPAGSFDTWPGSSLKVYYAKLKSTSKVAPIAKFQCEFEASLGTGSEYSGYEDEQIEYPMFAGLGSDAMDLGAGGALPNIRTEVLGSFSRYNAGDADFADMIEDIICNGLGQSSLIEPEQRNSLARGLNCFEWPGLVQAYPLKGALGIGHADNYIRTPQFERGFGESSILLVSASVAGDGTQSGAASFVDEGSHTWVPFVPDVRAQYRQLWYALPTNASRLTNQLTFTNLGNNYISYPEVMMLELQGVDALDSYSIAQSEGVAGLTSFTQEITIDTHDELPVYILSWFFISDDNGTTKTSSILVPSSPLKPACVAAQTMEDCYSFPRVHQRADYCIKRFPGTYSFTYNIVPLRTDDPAEYQVDSGTSWTWVLAAFKATSLPSLQRPLGELLDYSSLALCRQQCQNAGLFGSVAMNSQKKASEWLEMIYKAMNAAPVISGFKLKSIPFSEVSSANSTIYNSPTAPGPVADLTEDDFLVMDNEPAITIKRKGRLSSPNVMQLQYTNRGNQYNDISISEPCSGAIAQYGSDKADPLSMPIIQDVTVGRKVLSTQVRRENILRNTYLFKLPARWKLLEAMDIVTITDSILGIAQKPVRLLSVVEDKDHTLECEAELFVFGLHDPVDEATTSNVSYSPDRQVVPGLINTPIIFEAPLGLTKAGDPELWLAVSNADAEHGGCFVYVSLDGGTSYQMVGSVFGNAAMGILASTWATGTDPDTTNDLLVNLSMSNGVLASYSVADQDALVALCFVEGDDATHYELMSYAVAELTSAYNYTLKATGVGNHLRRGVHSSTVDSHSTGKDFVFLDPAMTGIFKYVLPDNFTGETLYFKFPAFNKFQGGFQSVSDCTAYSYTIGGIWAGKYQDQSQKGQANGYAGLGASATVPVAQLGTGTPTASKFLNGAGEWAQVTGALSADMDLYVATTGSDSNPGTSGSPFLTVQKAIDTAMAYDFGKYRARIHIGAGTFAGFAVTGPCKVAGYNSQIEVLEIIGNGKDSTTLTDASGVTAAIAMYYMRPGLYAHDLALDGSVNDALVGRGSWFRYSDVKFAACSDYQISTSYDSVAMMSGDCTIAGAAKGHAYGFASSVLRAASASYTLTLSSSYTFSEAFITLEGLSFGYMLPVISGAATGKRFLLLSGSTLYVGANTKTYLPGDVAGTVAAGSQYYSTTAGETLADFEQTSAKGAASGYAPLDSGSKVPAVNLGGAGGSSTKYLTGDQSWADYHGVPAGGSTSNILTKSSNTDYDYAWAALTNGVIPSTYVEKESSQTTTSATLEDVTGTSGTIVTTITTPIFFQASLHVSADGSCDLAVALNIDGVDTDEFTVHLTGVDMGNESITHRTAAVSAGTHTFKLRFRRASGSPKIPQIDRVDLVAIAMEAPRGLAGQGVPSGGTLNQILRKLSSTDYDTGWVDRFNKLLFEDFDDFVEIYPTTSSSAKWVYYSSGGGVTYPTYANRVGVVSLYKAVATSQTVLSSGQPYINVGTGEIVFECDVLLTVAPLGNSTVNSYVVRAGFLDVQSSSAANSINLQVVSDNTGTNKWRGRCVAASNSSFTNIALGYQPAANEWVRLKIVINAAATSVEFFVNGTSVGTIATNIPTTTDLYEAFQIWTVTGATSPVATYMHVDWRYISAVQSR